MSYPNIVFPLISVSMFFGFVRRMAYTCQSFALNSRLQRVFEYNPKKRVFFNVGGYL